MKPNSITHKKSTGFTLIEMIGVLAVIAILAAVLIPKVFEAINNARVSNAAISANTVKTAIADHYAKWGTLPVDGSSGTQVPLTAPVVSYDNVLVKEGFLDKPFATKLGDALYTRVDLVDISVNATNTGVAAPAASGAPIAAAAASFNLDATNAPNDVVGSYAVVAQISGVMLEDARALNNLIDGTGAALGEAGPNGGSGIDMSGRVKYNIGTAGSGTVYIYLTHR